MTTVVPAADDTHAVSENAITPDNVTDDMATVGQSTWGLGRTQA